MNVGMLQSCKRLADVGCDHAYTCIYAIENNICDYCYACDVRKGPLEIAKSNIGEYGLNDKIQTVLSDGLKLINPGDVDAVLISGMGGITICNILSEGLEVVKTLNEMVLQPQSDQAMVRHLVKELGFIIDNEEMCFEEGKYYTCIHCSRGEDIEYPEAFMYEYGKILLDKKDKTLTAFLDMKYRKLSEVKKQCELNKSGNNIESLDIELEMLSKAIAYIK